MTALHYSESLTRSIAVTAAYWSDVNEAREAIGEVAFDGLLIEAALHAASETEPSLLLEDIDYLRNLLDQIEAQVHELLAEKDADIEAAEADAEDNETTE